MSFGATYVHGDVTNSIERIFVGNEFHYVRLRPFVCADCPGRYTSELYSGARPTEAFCDTAHTSDGEACEGNKYRGLS
jgi:hypothetical protein